LLKREVKKIPQGGIAHAGFVMCCVCGLHSESGTHILEMTSFSVHILHVFKSVLQLNHAC
jgi:hypothetical protein